MTLPCQARTFSTILPVERSSESCSQFRKVACLGRSALRAKHAKPVEAFAIDLRRVRGHIMPIMITIGIDTAKCLRMPWPSRSERPET
jgi:hypothetical protein